MILVRFAGAMLQSRRAGMKPAIGGSPMETCFALKGSKHGTRLRISCDSYNFRWFYGPSGHLVSASDVCGSTPTMD